MDSRPLRPCPMCGAETRDGPRYPRSVCGICKAKATDSDGRQVAGFNTSLSGGFEARYRTSGNVLVATADRRIEHGLQDLDLPGEQPVHRRRRD